MDPNLELDQQTISDNLKAVQSGKIASKEEVEALITENGEASSSVRPSPGQDVIDLVVKRHPNLTRARARQLIEAFGG